MDYQDEPKQEGRTKQDANSNKQKAKGEIEEKGGKERRITRRMK